MPRSKRPQKIGSLVNRYFADKGIDKKIENAKVIETWAAIAGVETNSVTRSVYIKDNRLFVQITSAPLRQRLFMQKREWLLKLNEQLGNDRIKSINFR